MPPLPPPPGSTTAIHARSALVLAPHFDDEVLGCGGLVLELTGAGASVHVLFISDGGEDSRPTADSGDRDAYVETRRREAAAAVEALGATSGELGFRDGALGQQLDEISEAISEALTERSPELLLVPAPTERSADHRATFAAVHRCLTAPGASAPEDLKILLYEVNHPLYPDVLVAVETHLPALEAAMGHYRSQLERHDYWPAALGRRRFRAHTLPSGTGAVEAYRSLSVDDFKTHSRSALWRLLGAPDPPEPIGEGPLVSVIVRTRDRPELLAEALESLADSRYRRLEVLLVNDGGAAPEVPGDFPFPLELIDLQPGRGRAGAANAGLENARGEYVAFLDDDDRIEPEHYATLVDLVGAAGVRVAYTDAAVVVFELGDGGWRQTERRLTYSRDFDADLLLFDNYIPFHTLLIERNLIEEVGTLDPDLPFFEDWDWLIRLARKTPFHHRATVTCEYRQFRGGGHHILGDGGRERDDFLAMKAEVLGRHRSLIEPARLAAVIDGLRAETVAAQEEGGRLRRELAAERASFHRTNGALRASEDRRRQLEALDERSQERGRELEARLEDRARHVTELERQIRELHVHQGEQGEALEAAYAEIRRLGELIEAMEATSAWRLHQKLQGLKGG
ncbi:MAG: PIG-L family deacetylase [Acidobacteriota bacterium]